jgi:hypothetical protein
MQRAVEQQLARDEQVPACEFANPAHTTTDSAVLAHMLRGICELLEQDPVLVRSGGLHFERQEPFGKHRYVIPDPKLLLKARGLSLVGFFGQKRSGAPENYFGNLGLRLADKVPAYEGVLVYNTLRLPNGNFGNLVLVKNEQAKVGWLTGNTHAKAVQISPGYYATIRIYNGRLIAGIGEPGNFKLDRVKYLDYLKDPVWRAVRPL